MREVYTNLFVGDELDYEAHSVEMASWFVVHACKEPYHRRALGYTTKGAPKGPYYFFLYNNRHHLILNIVDGVPKDFYDDGMINEAVNYAIQGLKTNRKVLIHCNQGESRAPSIAMLVMKKLGVLENNFAAAFKTFINFYPIYNPSQGILNFVKEKWEEDL